MAAKFSKEEQYAVLSLIHLTQVERGAAVQVREIAKSQKIPERFLELILAKLRVAGLVHGKRGPGGGYWLARDARQICLRDVITALKPDSAEKVAADESRFQKVIDSMWEEISLSFDSVLNRVSIADLSDKARGLSEEEDPLSAAVSSAVVGVDHSFSDLQ